MKKTGIIYIVIVFAVLLVANSCANRGIGPQGGPKDETPPEVVKEVPVNGSVNYHDKRVEITFNEYVQLDKVSENVFISPPQQRPPEVKAVGKKVTVTFDEDLRDSTTYTIDFGSAICDNNERNALKGYTFAFATGDVIDSLVISGRVLNAEDLNFVSGIVVGIHQNLNDSAIRRMPFTRIGKTDENGYFTIRNVHPGQYKIYALGDVSKDYIYQPGEGLAIYDSLIYPECHTEIVIDTIKLDTLITDSLSTDSIVISDTLQQIHIDSVPPVNHDTTLNVVDSVHIVTTDTMQIAPTDSLRKTYNTVCTPDDLILIYFTENKQRQYFQRVLREQQNKFVLYFAARQDSMPKFRAIDPYKSKVDSLDIDSLAADSLYNSKYDFIPSSFIQTNVTKDTITFWLTDSVYISSDTLAFEMIYQKTDSLYELQWQTDTIFAVYRAPRLTEKARERLEKEKSKNIPKVEVRSNGSSPFEIYNPLTFNTSVPLRLMEHDSIHLYEMYDTVPKPLAVHFMPVDSSYMSYQLEYQWKPETTYRLVMDSAAFTDIYGSVNDKYKAEFTTRTLDEYSTLIIKIEPFDTNAMIQVLDDKDVPVQTRRALAEGTKFEYLSPKSYYVRLYLDLNGDSVWTTGDFQTHRKPEPVYYFSSKLTLRANWDFEETFNYLEIPIEEQKPKEITKDATKKK